jgi:hypothetical protein
MITQAVVADREAARQLGNAGADYEGAVAWRFSAHSKQLPHERRSIWSSSARICSSRIVSMDEAPSTPNSTGDPKLAGEEPGIG